MDDFDDSWAYREEALTVLRLTDPTERGRGPFPPRVVHRYMGRGGSLARFDAWEVGIFRSMPISPVPTPISGIAGVGGLPG